MKVLVTGGSGFIGSHVVDRLRDDGHQVRVFDMVPYTHRPDVEWYKGSILDFDDVRFALAGIQAIYHLAAVADVNDVFADPLYADAVNVRGTIHVLEAARRSRINRVILGSTVWAYSESSEGEGQVDENTALNPPNHLYTATKVAAEYYCHAYSKLYGLSTTVLRYGIPYGPRARGAAVIPTFVKKALNHEPISITGDGMQFRKFVFVKDLAEANVLALKPIAENKVYNIEGAEKTSIRRLAELVQKLVGNVEVEFKPGRTGDFSGKEISSQKALKELGWEPTTKIEEGLKQYIEWYRSNN